MEKLSVMLALCGVCFFGGCDQLEGEELEGDRLDEFLSESRIYEGAVDSERLGLGVNEIEPSFVSIEFERCNEDANDVCAHFGFEGTLELFSKELEGPYSEFIDENLRISAKGVGLVAAIEHDDKTFIIRVSGRFTKDQSATEDRPATVEGIEANIRASIEGDALPPLGVGKIMLAGEHPFVID